MNAVLSEESDYGVTGEPYQEEAELEPPPLPCPGREMSDIER